MIPSAYIIEWQQFAPWQTNAQVEQDLVIERALIALFSNDIIRENLAFRGGTALHKIFMKPQARYSEDIDLVQIKPGPINPVMKEIRNAMDFLGFKRNTKQNLMMNTIVYRFDTEIAPVINSRLKLEINSREHFSILGWKMVNHELSSSWFSGSAEIVSYELEELLGTKLRALYQRSKGRDLFDLYYALVVKKPDCDKIANCFKKYMEFSNGEACSAAELTRNLDDKMLDPDFIGDTKGLLRPEITYDINVAYELVKKELIERI
ncbi:MAG: nucleotidyl transferase AbiEii/AbiGii toxin family protein [Lentimicrobium sp.]|nr:nucleotidyl transferase AbiEii/AbiGii toxin family protein [Lentimicrobium sp.]